MKSVTCLIAASAAVLSGCSTMGRPYVSDDACRDIVDAKERLDCYDRAAKVESDWREEKRQEAEKREIPDADED